MTATHDFARGLAAAGDMPAALTRRDFLTGGGALIISFSIAGPAPFAAAAEGTTAGPPIRASSTSGSLYMTTTQQPCSSASASLAKARQPACCRSPARSWIST